MYIHFNSLRIQFTIFAHFFLIVKFLFLGIKNDFSPRHFDWKFHWKLYERYQNSSGKLIFFYLFIKSFFHKIIYDVFSTNWINWINLILKWLNLILNTNIFNFKYLILFIINVSFYIFNISLILISFLYFDKCSNFLD